MDSRALHRHSGPGLGTPDWLSVTPARSLAHALAFARPGPGLKAAATEDNKAATFEAAECRHPGLNLLNRVTIETVRGLLPVIIRSTPSSGNTDAPMLMSSGPGMSTGPTGGLDAIGSGTGTRIFVTPAKPLARPRISAGVSAGMLLDPIRPLYPSIAKAAHVEGTVILTATIDKSGHIVGLQVVSGPAMLRSAAVDAVKTSRYRPFLLNGEATDVETTISVNFRIGGA